MEQRLSVLARRRKITSARILVSQAGSRVVFWKLCVQAVGGYTAVYGNKSVSLGQIKLLQVAGDDEGSLSIT